MSDALPDQRTEEAVGQRVTTPTPYVAPSLPPPNGNVLTRGLRALFVEHRLPYTLSIMLDKACRRLGLRRKTVRVRGYEVRIRRLTSDENFVKNILVKQDYTPPGYTIEEADTVIDIGGNIGTFALHAARSAPRGKVFTFEPNDENYRLLLENISRNRMRNIVARKAAVSASRTPIRIYVHPTSGGHHTVVPSRASDLGRSELVPSVTLADIFDEYHIDRCHFLKLDCEGSEYDILYGLAPEYFTRIDRIAMEYHGERDATARQARSNALVAYLQDVGFQIDAYFDFTDFDCGFIRARRRGLDPDQP